jgi:hypothetical protein
MPLLTQEELEAQWRKKGEEAGFDMSKFRMETRWDRSGSRYPVFIRGFVPNKVEMCASMKDDMKCHRAADHEGPHQHPIYWKD